MSGTVDFGAPSEFGRHHFYVEIPPGPRDAVVLYEDYGFDAREGPRETVECRVVLPRELWTKIRDAARRDFNARLKEKKQSTGSWRVGRIKLDRFLGRELCVLAWGAEHATPGECPGICRKWLALRPEERWWLYSKTASEAGEAEQRLLGWRQALYWALSEGSRSTAPPQVKPRSSSRDADQEILTRSLFETFKGES